MEIFDDIDCEILFCHLGKIRQNDRALDEVMSQIELEYFHPSLANLSSQFKKTTCDLDAERIGQQLEKSLSESAIEAYELLSGDKFSSPNKLDVLHFLNEEVNKLKGDLERKSILDKKIRDAQQQMIDAKRECLTVLKEHLEQKINFELPFDDADTNLLCARAQALCLKVRFEETESMVNKYGDRTKIKQLQDRRARLEAERAALLKQKAELELQLKEYELLPADLLNEYKKLSEELRLRQWAVEYVQKVPDQPE